MLPAAMPRPPVAGGGLLRSAYVRLLRPGQWVKNGFVLAAVVFSGRFLYPDAVVTALRASLVFCIASSMIYVINDILDREWDRRHPLKQFRPIAAGEISVGRAVAIAGVLCLSGAVLAIGFPTAFGLTVLGYVVLNLVYSAWLKHMVILDVFCIALSFALRVVGGSAAIDVHPSPWVLLCTMGLALFLAAAKRRQELALMASGAGETRQILAEYAPGFLDKLMLLSVNLVVVCYPLFALAVRPDLAWGIPFVLYGIFRYYFIVEQKGMGESPTDALFQDRPLLLCVLSWILLNIVIISWAQ